MQVYRPVSWTSTSATQLTLSLSVGVTSFLVFCWLRRYERFRVLYAPRTMLKGFAAHEVHDHESFFGFVLPTLRTSEFVVLQLVGLDAAVLLSFLRTGFYFFLTCSILAFALLVPVNWRENGTIEGVPPPTANGTSSLLYEAAMSPSIILGHQPRIQRGSTLYLSAQLLFTYLFTILTLLFLRRNWRRYIPLRQLFSLGLAQSIPARTVMVTSLPPHLRSERALADYFEGLQLGPKHPGDARDGRGGRSAVVPGLAVESVVVTRAIGSMRELLERRTRALTTLEEAWAKYLGNPVPVEGKKAVFGYERDLEVEAILHGPVEAAPSVRPDGSNAPAGPATARLVDVDDEDDGHVEVGGNSTEMRDPDDDLEARLLSPAHPPIVNPSRKRPRLRPHWFTKKVDALDYYAEQFRLADEAVRRRRKGKFRPTGVAFVTFQTMAAAQVAAQTVHYPTPNEFHTELAPEPRDIHWFNLNLSSTSVFIRHILVGLTLLLLLSVWSVPVAALASLLSWDTIRDVAPRLAKLLGKSPRLRSIVQTTLPSLAMVAFNNVLPMFLEALSVFQGLQARSWIELSQLKKYHLSLLFTTLFVFITTSTVTLLRDISESPMKVLDKLATTLPDSRNFFVSYVMLAGLAVMPLQLLELATVIPRMFYQLFLTKTPRDHATLNAPTSLNLGVVYPQALLIWTIGITYSIITPLILPFAMLYFGLAYFVYKYRFLFVFYRPYESRGQAWPLAYNRVGLGLLIFQIFMLGLFTVRKVFLLVVLMLPLVAATVYTVWHIGKMYEPLARFVNLSQACEVTNGDGTNDVDQLRKGHPVSKSQTLLNRGRYGHRGDGVYAVAKNPCTDYSQPPLSEMYPGVLNTGGSSRYGHPALFGALPEPWLPVLAVPTETLPEVPQAVKDALLVVDLRRGWRNLKRAAKQGISLGAGGGGGDASAGPSSGGASRGGRRRRATSWGSLPSEEEDEDPSRAWRGSRESTPHHSQDGGEFDYDDEDEEDEDDDQDENGNPTSRYSTFFPHRPRHGLQFPPTPGNASETEDEG
ncbi:hypothetical protein JCM10908_003473 [Rhodotorula pacifica]|uniref:uncharacterized protein n=1 Tax=Rhodotorula pacifica TaxID=1495444 RepID=UPI00317005B1